jgi:hypothetical protein
MPADRVKDYGAFNELPKPTPAPVVTPTTKSVGSVGSVSTVSGLTITGNERNAAKEAEAKSIGYSAEYIASRGGINSQGYFNDTPISGQLTADEQKQVRLPNGTTDTIAMARILQDKQRAELKSQGFSDADIDRKFSSEWGELYNAVSGGSNVGGYDANGKPLAGGQYDAQGKYVGGGTSGTSLPGGNIDKNTRDAYAILEDTFKAYGLETLVPTIRGYMESNLGAEQAKLQLKQEKVYKERFAGNTARLNAGLNALSESDYLGLEDYYSQTMNEYGLGSYFGADRNARIKSMADIIGGDVSPAEFKSRVSTVVERVNNSDPGIKTQLKDFYNISDTDLVNYFLNPAQTLPKLQEKVTAAEIGTAAISQGLGTSMASAEDLARFGVDRATAIKGYSTIGSIVPEAQKLSDIYGEAKIDYTQKTAEEEVFKGNASAARKRRQLAQLEQASFSGKSGLGSQAAGLNRSIQGSF